MELHIQTRRVNLDEATRELVERRFMFALDQFDGFVMNVDVILEDVNGPRGGVDKYCRVLASLRGGKYIKIEDQDADLISVVNRAADRLSQVVARELDRKRDKKGTHSAGSFAEEEQSE
ncbi:HPF/RaiA family ribosome-associated protein [Thermogutta sp.]|jgi:ribosome-associated translation inhibitor RaiA|uniref:HPF/RaiA family ribosome-associated protein n=1 Tax=Thermogutta sp. TaxID=1962930 RepID=UPI003C7D6890